MKKLSLWFAAIVALFATSADALEMINDPHFQAGFTVNGLNGIAQGPLQYTTAYGAPKWQLAQWDSVQSIYGTSPVALGAGAVKWQNNYTTVGEGPTTTGYADLQLGVNSVNVFNNVYRTSSQPWPAVLAQQGISGPGGWLGDDAPSIGQMTSANFNIDVLLTKSDNIYRSGYDPNLHVSQVPLYFSVQNLNPQSADYGKYFWLGIGIYNDIHSPTLEGKAVLSDGTLIYSLGLGSFGKAQGPQVGTWMNISGDILPYMQDALQYAWAHNILTASTDYADYKIAGMNVGWEVPGLGDVNMQIKNLSLNVGLVPEPGTLAMLAAGLVGLLAFAWRKH